MSDKQLNQARQVLGGAFHHIAARSSLCGDAPCSVLGAAAVQKADLLSLRALWVRIGTAWLRVAWSASPTMRSRAMLAELGRNLTPHAMADLGSGVRRVSDGFEELIRNCDTTDSLDIAERHFLLASLALLEGRPVDMAESIMDGCSAAWWPGDRFEHWRRVAFALAAGADSEISEMLV